MSKFYGNVGIWTGPLGTIPPVIEVTSLKKLYEHIDDFGILTWSTSAVCFGPPWAQQTSTLDLSVSLDSEAGVGLESQGGTIRADSVGVSAWGGNDSGGVAETARAPAVGAGGDSERGTGAAQEDGETAREDGSGCGVHRCDSGSGSQVAAQAAAHGEAYLGTHSCRSTGMHGGRAHGATVCGAPQRGVRIGSA